MAEFKEGENVLCTVDKISGTTVFVRIEENGGGTIVTSEIAPGRIRNLRDYVIPGKKIVCKILKIDTGNINLSLRRVSNKERQEVLEKYEKERAALSVLKSVLNEKATEVAEKVKKSHYLHEFLSICKTNPKKLEDYMNKQEAEKVYKILQQQKEKQVEIKKEFSLKSNLSDSIVRVRKILMPYKENIIYLAAGKFVIKIIASDYKKANSEMQKILENIEKNSEKDKLEFEAEK